MKLIPALLLGGMLVVSGCSKEGGWVEGYTIKPYSPELAKRAEAGDAVAQYRLATCYYFGEGVTQDYKEAAKWLTKAAEQGDENAQYKLGVCYYQGKGVTQDYKEAVFWLTKAAEHGFAEAKKELEKIKSK